MIEFSLLNDLFEACWEKWGEEAQIDMVMEEAAELIQAVAKFKRAKSPVKAIEALTHVAEEFGDVLLIGLQLIHVKNLKGELEESLAKKVDRIERRLIDTGEQK